MDVAAPSLYSHSTDTDSSRQGCSQGSDSILMTRPGPFCQVNFLGPARSQVWARVPPAPMRVVGGVRKGI